MQCVSRFGKRGAHRITKHMMVPAPLLAWLGEVAILDSQDGRKKRKVDKHCGTAQEGAKGIQFSPLHFRNFNIEGTGEACCCVADLQLEDPPHVLWNASNCKGNTTFRCVVTRMLTPATFCQSVSCPNAGLTGRCERVHSFGYVQQGTANHVDVATVSSFGLPPLKPCTNDSNLNLQVKLMDYSVEEKWIIMEYLELGDLYNYIAFHHNEKADIFSFAMLMYEIVTGIHPFQGVSGNQDVYNWLYKYP